MASDGLQRTLVFRPHIVGRAVLLMGFAVFTLLALFSISQVLDRGNLPPHQADMPQLALVAFVAFFLFAISWNAYWFLWGTALEVRVRGGSLHWQTAFRSGTMRLNEVTQACCHSPLEPAV